jgi:hypothetical protein
MTGASPIPAWLVSRETARMENGEQMYGAPTRRER